MGAKYPDDIITFTTKRDLVDDVMAEHVNSLQEEVRAIEVALGLNPQKEAGYPGSVAVSYTTVGDRMHALGNGDNIIVGAATQGAGLFVPKSVSNWDLGITQLQDFNGGYDPNKMVSRKGFTLPEDGWWVFTGAAKWAQGSGGITFRKTAILLEGSVRSDVTGSYPAESRADGQVTLEGYFTRGQKIGLGVAIAMSSTSLSGLNIVSGDLTARLVRKVTA